MTTKSSLNDLIQKILVINNNSLSILKGLTDSLISTQESINVEITTANNTKKTYIIPSLSFLKWKINSFDDVLNILKSQKKLPKSSEDINNIVIFSNDPINKPTIDSNVIIEKNSLIDNLVSDTSKVSVDLFKKVSPFTKKVQVEEYLFRDLTKEQLEKFKLLSDSNIPLSFDHFVSITKNNNLVYQSKTYNLDLNGNIIRSVGQFIITEYVQDEATNLSLVSGQSNYSKSYVFNDIFYKNYSKDGVYSLNSLKVGDSLVFDDLEDSIFEILNITKRNEKNIVTLLIKYGNKILNQGDVLKVKSDIIEDKRIYIDIKYKDKKVLFFKEINDIYNTISLQKGEGVIVDSELLFVNQDGLNIPYNDYYSEKIYDFSEYINSLKIDMKIPSYMGIQPDPPILNNSNFRVLRINSHRQSPLNKDAELLLSDVTLKIARRNSTQSLLSEKRSELNLMIQADPTNVNIPILESYIITLQTEINTLNTEITSYNSQLKQFNISLSEINNVDPKYHIRGFWDFPNPKIDKKNRKQDVIQFRVQYRYLDILENPACNAKINYTSLDGTQKDAIFSEWVEYKSEVRKKRFDEITGKYVWDYENIQESIPNVNQLSIPINPFEKVEVRIKSISEAGYPENPIESEWSVPILIEFPNDFISSDIETSQINQTLQSTVNQNQVEINYNELINRINYLQQQLETKILSTGVYQNVPYSSALGTDGLIPLIAIPDSTTLMVFNLKLGTILNPIEDYTLTGMIVTLSTDIRSSLVGDEKFLLTYKSIS